MSIYRDHYVRSIDAPPYYPPSVIEFITYAADELMKVGRYKDAQELLAALPADREGE